MARECFDYVSPGGRRREAGQGLKDELRRLHRVAFVSQETAQGRGQGGPLSTSPAARRAARIRRGVSAWGGSKQGARAGGRRGSLLPPAGGQGHASGKYIYIFCFSRGYSDTSAALTRGLININSFIPTSSLRRVPRGLPFHREGNRAADSSQKQLLRARRWGAEEEIKQRAVTTRRSSYYGLVTRPSVSRGGMAQRPGGQAPPPAGRPVTRPHLHQILPPRAAVVVKRDNTNKALGTASGTYEVLRKQPFLWLPLRSNYPCESEDQSVQFHGNDCGDLNCAETQGSSGRELVELRVALGTTATQLAICPASSFMSVRKILPCFLQVFLRFVPGAFSLQLMWFC